jgi:tRNA(fMet)-specific endonuclease VapC
LGVKDLYLFDEFEGQIKIFFLDKDNDSIFKETIKIRKKYKLKLPDAIIAATAIVNNATLLSADDIFAKIYNLKFELIKT